MRKYTFAETDSMVVQEWDGHTAKGSYTVSGNTLMITWDGGIEGELTITRNKMTNKSGFTLTKVK